MKWEYLIFNVIVFTGPFLAIAFYSGIRIPRLKESLIAVIIPAFFFILWDQAVTGWFWDFNPLYTLGLKFFKLPLEEVLFFLSVPWSCLFLWENLKIKNKEKSELKWHLPLIFSVIMAGLFFLLQNLFYSSSVFLVLAFILYLDNMLKTYIFSRKNFTKFIILVFLLTIIFNGYLTARPVVIYNEVVKTNLNIFTIPVEDIIYGLALIIWVVVIYENKLSKNKINVQG